MYDYVIVSDLTMDLPSDLKNNLGILTLPMEVLIGDKVYQGDKINVNEFYSKMRQKVPASTTQINPSEFEEYFCKYLEKGMDILYICLSSGLSGMYNSACSVAKELERRYPDRKLKVVDSLSASLGVGHLAIVASEMRMRGSSIEETEKSLNELKNKICHWFVVDDLYHLKRGGRISASKALVGSMMNIKPVLKIDNEGKLVVCENVRGRKRAFETLLSKFEECASKKNIKNESVYISHADCEDDAKFLADEIKKRYGAQKIIMHSITPVIGVHTGAGTLALIFPGSER